MAQNPKAPQPGKNAPEMPSGEPDLEPEMPARQGQEPEEPGRAPRSMPGPETPGRSAPGPESPGSPNKPGR